MSISTTMSPADVMDRVERLVPALGERAAEADVLRQLPAETIADVEQLDLFRMVLPTSLGGHGLDLATLCQATRVLAHGCVSSAWTTSFLIMHNWLLARFPDEALQEFFGGAKPWRLAAAPTAPTGTCVEVDGGYELTGRWEWATGIQHSDWVVVHAMGSEPFATRFFALPVSDVIVDDVWHTAGMRGTGSNVVRVDGCFVPAHHSVSAAQFGGVRTDLEGDGMSGLPMAPVLALMASAPALGAAEAAVALYRERVEQRILAYSLAEKAKEQPAAQMRLGAAMADLGSVRARWDAALEQLGNLPPGDALTIRQRAGLRLVASDTVRRSRAIINDVAVGSGASVYFETSPFQRLQRDVETLKGHVIFDWDRTTELVGRVELGFELGPADMV